MIRHAVDYHRDLAPSDLYGKPRGVNEPAASAARPSESFTRLLEEVLDRVRADGMKRLPGFKMEV